MPPILETARIRLRPANKKDLANIYRLGSNPKVMQYITQGKTQAFEEAKADLKKRMRTAEMPLGYWITERIEDNAFIGWMALKQLNNTPDIEIGYRFLEERWGQGYATEGAKRILDYAFTDLKLEKVMAVAIKENRASTRVMEKLGMQYEGVGNYYGVDCVRYIIRKKDYFTQP